MRGSLCVVQPAFPDLIRTNNCSPLSWNQNWNYLGYQP